MTTIPEPRKIDAGGFEVYAAAKVLLGFKWCKRYSSCNPDGGNCKCREKIAEAINASLAAAPASLESTR